MRGWVQLQWICFEDSFSTFAHFIMGDLWTHLPTPHWVFSSFWPKTACPPCPTLPIHLISPQTTFFLFCQDKIILKRKCFADVEEVKQKLAEALKGIKINEFKNCFEQWKKGLNRCIASNGWLKFKHVGINTQFFINKFHFFEGGSLLYTVYIFSSISIIYETFTIVISWLVKLFLW